MLDALKPKKSTIILYLIIPVAMFVFTVFVPLVTAFYFSFFEWKSGPVKTFNGIANYKLLFADSTFWASFGHNLYLVAVCIIGQIGIAFILVLFANSRLAKGQTIHRTFGFFPSFSSPASGSSGFGIVSSRAASNAFIVCQRSAAFCASAFISTCFSRENPSGTTKITLHPRFRAANAIPMPVFPAVASTMEVPG